MSDKSKSLSESEKRLERHIQKQKAKILLENKNREGLTLKKKCFSEKRYFDMTFQNSIDQSQAYASAYKYAKEFFVFFKKGVGLIFYGSTGTGKTYLASAIANDLCEKHYSCKLTTLQREVDTILNSNEPQAYIEQLTSPDLLILDDFGSEVLNNLVIAKAFEIINRRYEKRKPLILTTNWSKKDLLEPKDERLKPILSRLYEMSLIVSVQGGDHRVKKFHEDLRAFSDIYKPLD